MVPSGAWGGETSNLSWFTCHSDQRLNTLELKGLGGGGLETIIRTLNSPYWENYHSGVG